jgi:hypothetical protein
MLMSEDLTEAMTRRESASRSSGLNIFRGCGSKARKEEAMNKRLAAVLWG